LKVTRTFSDVITLTTSHLPPEIRIYFITGLFSVSSGFFTGLSSFCLFDEWIFELISHRQWPRYRRPRHLGRLAILCLLATATGIWSTSAVACV
jgi:hypothetical protein